MVIARASPAQAGHREVFVQKKTGAPIKRKRLTAGNAIIDGGFDAFVRTSWQQLGAKKALQAPFVIPSRLEAMDFSIRHIGDTPAGRKIRLSLNRWYGAALPHIDVVYNVATRTLLHYRGLGNIRGNDGKHRVVDIEFPPAHRKTNVETSEVDAAVAATLVRRCPS